MLQLQHGDVLLQQVERLPEGVTKLNHGVVMDGEATGHKHQISTKTSTLWELEGQLYLEVEAPTVITHDEHKPIEIPEGIYHIGQVREYDYLREMERNVVD